MSDGKGLAAEDQDRPDYTWSPMIVGIVLTILIFSLAIGGSYLRSSELLELELNEVGDLLAGVAGTLAFVWLIVAVFVQRAELRAQRDEWKRMGRALEAQAAIFADEKKHRTEIRVDAELEEVLVDLQRLIIKYKPISAYSVTIDPFFGFGSDIDFPKVESNPLNWDKKSIFPLALVANDAPDVVAAGLRTSLEHSLHEDGSPQTRDDHVIAVAANPQFIRICANLEDQVEGALKLMKCASSAQRLRVGRLELDKSLALLQALRRRLTK